jgi:hypothetical protein
MRKDKKSIEEIMLKNLTKLEIESKKLKKFEEEKKKNLNKLKNLMFLIEMTYQNIDSSLIKIINEMQGKSDSEKLQIIENNEELNGLLS